MTELNIYETHLTSERAWAVKPDKPNHSKATCELYDPPTCQCLHCGSEDDNIYNIALPKR